MRIKLLGTQIDVFTMEETIAQVNDYIQKHKFLHLMGVNADKINMMHTDEKLKKIVNSCGVINADGASVVLGSRFLGHPLPERVAGVDLMQNLVTLAAQNGYSIYLLGAKQEIVEKTAEKLKQKHVGLNICGVRNGYFRDADWENIADDIRQKSPDIVFIGISSPKKEYLVEYFESQKLDCVFMGVGGSFDVLSGFIPRAPEWMQKANLEWLFRLSQEPRRLWKRYLVGNSVFLFRITRQKFLSAGRN